MSGPVLAAVTRSDVAGYVQTLVIVYVVLIFIRVLMSYVTRMPYNIVLDKVLTFVRDVTDPYLNLWRRILPMARIGPAAMDLSPMVGTIVLIIVGNIVSALIAG
ncbi:MAG: YggT family protein [Thermoleophilaceae bacterium]|nr:YggT family protein [Thermoleophilaceae bacterium]